MIIKVCGMTEGENIRQTESAGAEWIGFIFYPPSPRFASRMPDYLPEHARRVGVFVDTPTKDITEIARNWGLDLVQLHGKEPPAQCRELQEEGLEVIKAFSVRDRATLDDTAAYEDVCSYFLFDTPCTGYGGSGRSFNWNLTEHYQGCIPFLLGGGITPGSLGELAAFSHPQWAGIDLNSGFERVPGIKNPQAIARFVRMLGTLHKTTGHSD